MKFRRLCVLVFLSLLMACTGNKRKTEGEVSPAPAADNELSKPEPTKITGATVVLDGTWILKTFNTETMGTSDAYKIPTLTIEEDEGKVIGNAGCNQFTGTLEVKGDKHVSIEAEKVSELDCPGSSLEDDFLKAIKAEGLAYRMMDEDQLIFYTDSITLIFQKSK